LVVINVKKGKDRQPCKGVSEKDFWEGRGKNIGAMLGSFVEGGFSKRRRERLGGKGGAFLGI